MIVLIINGVPNAGKTEFLRILSECNKGRVVSYSSIDWVKDIARDMGWDGVKDARGRQFLSDIKKSCIDYDDIPIKKVVDEIEKHRASGEYDFMGIDIREPQEIYKLKIICKEKGITCYTLFIQNNEAIEILKESNINNTSDNNTEKIPYDIVVRNNYSLSHLKNKVFLLHKKFLRKSIRVSDDLLFEAIEKPIPVDRDQIILNSDIYQNSIKEHHSKLPVPVLDETATMYLINALALCGEAGEIANIIKKVIWYKNGKFTDDIILKIQEEIGDNLYHSSQLATMVKTKLSIIMDQSIVKCTNRGTDEFTY